MGKVYGDEFKAAVVNDFIHNERTSRESGDIWDVSHSTVLQWLHKCARYAEAIVILDANAARSRFGGR